MNLTKEIKKKSWLVLFAAFGLSSSLLAEEDFFPFNPPQNFSLFIDQGLVHHPVSTANPEAQRFFDQGLTLVYGFNHDAAYWSFATAAKIDPNLAMAYWGMALALGSNINMTITPSREEAAYRLIQKAMELSNQATDNEKAYIQALAERYTADSAAKQESLNQNYKNAMEKVAKQFPDDLDAAVLFAESALDLNPWNQWDPAGNPRPGTLAILDVLESVLKRDPDHLGANHYYIHAIEASKYPERALMSAHRLRRLLPQSGHILHMPSHIYLLVGDYHLAAICNEQAVAADRAYIKQYGMQGIYPLHYLSHNLYFLSRAYSMEGRFEDAKRAGDELYSFYAPHFQKMPELEYYAPTSLFVLLRFHRWQDILAFPLPTPRMAVSTILWHYGRAMALAALNQLPEARKEQALFIQEKNRLRPETVYGYNKIEPILSIADLTLKAKIAEAQGDHSAAIYQLREAISIEDQLHYNEPPDWVLPVRENLGGVLLRSGQYAEAEQIFREDLNKHPRNGRSLFGLLASLKSQSRETDAFWVQREFEKAWQYSTVSLKVADL
ncbi:hypothetical protein [Candidatus Protochlamydia phocaeensis]|uniref:hypothetical protein n=1 Tax=Candidatus Protochlamydia phocaeensis TaxID=1414722 RepID=UPI0012AB2E56|nr:hypothetical protein [Candidatus Protochlamydia phocaeensis]